jgi:heterodisulfide reductase subunit D
MSAIRELRRVSGAMRCLECGKCSTLCPLSLFRDFSAARMAAIHDASSDLLDHAATVSRCLTCAACEVRCPQGVHFSALVRGLRDELPHGLRDSLPHGGVLQSAARLMAEACTSIGDRPDATVPHRDLSWLGPDLRVAERGEIALFAGCAPLFDVVFEKDLGVASLETIRAAIRLLNAAGIEPVLVDEELCCGHDLLWSGESETFRALAAANATAFEGRGVKKIITTCAECARTWRLDYKDAVPRYRPQVQHFSEWLAQSGLKFAVPDGGRVTFQDPCRLARHLGVVDAPRSLLESMGADLVEMTRNGLDAQCCGTPGFIRCDSDSRALQQQRLDEALATGAGRLLTACPKCRIHLTCAQAEDGLRGRDRAAIEIEDLAVFAARHLTTETPQERS